MARPLRRIAFVICLTATLVASGASTFAQSDASTPLRIGPDSHRTPNKDALVGTWLETVTFPPEMGRPPLKSLVTFHGDGTMVNSDQGGVTIDPPLVVSSGHGGWRHLRNRRFAYTQRTLLSDLNGNLTGYLKVRGVYTVSDSGNEYTGTSFAEVFDTNDVLLFSVWVTNAAQRIQVELP
jgi:hypothetical protein